MSTDPGDPYRSGAYAHDNPDWHDADAPAKADGLAPWLARVPRPPGLVLDVGCGTGRVLAELKHRFDDRWSTTQWEGWDVAGEAIRRARAHRGERLRFVCGDVLKADVTADLCLMLDVMEHLPDDEGFLAQVARLAPWHVLRIPLDLSALDVVRPARLLEARERYGHRHLYTRDIALDRVRRAGLTVVGTAYHAVPVVPGSWRGRWLAPVRRGLSALAPDLAARALGGTSLVVLARAR